MKKKIVIAALVIVLVVLLFPTRSVMKDGGSVCYKSLTYEITKIHKLAPIEDTKPYIDGLEIKLFGVTVYCMTNE